MQFIKTVIAVIFGVFVSFFGILFILVAIGTMLGSQAQESQETVSENSVLKLNLNMQISELAPEDPLQELPLPEDFKQQAKLSLPDIKAAILKAKDDENIKAIQLQASNVAAGMPVLEEIRTALEDFKTSKKPIYAYGEYFTEKSLYLVSVADRIFLNPTGSLELNGLSAEIMFFKGFFEKIGVKPEIFRVGTFKSAVEPFMLTQMSEENRMQTTQFLTQMYEVYLEKVSKARQIPLDSLRHISQKMLVRLPKDALTYKLVTDIGYMDEFEKVIKDHLKIKEKDKISYVSLSKYAKNATGNYSKNKIAVVVAEGEIVQGKGQDDQIGGDKIAEELRKARLNDDIKAVVLRINSPGGSLTGSDVIWREISLFKGKKPIIASMSDVAASGGYYIAMACDTIVAHPHTLTGSIGIFGILFNAQDLLTNKLGFTFDKVSTGDFSDLGTMSRSMNEGEKQIIQNSVNEGYETFTSKAAKGRKMDIEKLKSVASGRVWTGSQAKENGLVDVLGSLEDAVALAAKSAGVEKEYRVRYYPVQEDFMSKFLKSTENSVKSYQEKNAFGELYPYLKEVQKISQNQGVQARLPYILEIQ